MELAHLLFWLFSRACLRMQITFYLASIKILSDFQLVPHKITIQATRIPNVPSLYFQYSETKAMKQRLLTSYHKGISMINFQKRCNIAYMNAKVKHNTYLASGGIYKEDPASSSILCKNKVFMLLEYCSKKFYSISMNGAS